MKKIAASLLSSAAMLGMIPIGSQALDPLHTALHEGVTYNYDITDGKAEILSVSGAKGQITIPSELESYTVVSIGDKAFLGSAELESVCFPDTLENIGQSAFAGCTSITQLSIPDSVKTIGDSAFMGCTNLSTVSVGKGITEIPADCFFSCPSLADINLPDNLQMIGNEAFYGCPDLYAIIPETVTYIGYYALGYQQDVHSPVTVKTNDFIVGGKIGSAAETYANEYGLDFLDPDNYLEGDVNKDGKVDAKDASAVLAEYSSASTGSDLTFTRWQRIVGDMKQDSIIDANDASRILIEYARLSTLPDLSL